MFDIGFSELLVIAVVALIVIGPERLPKVARTMGALFGRAQRYVNEVKADIEREVNLDELKNIRTTFQDAARSVEHSVREAGRELEAATDELQAAGESLNQSLNQGFSTMTESATELNPGAPSLSPPSDVASGSSAASAQMVLGLESKPDSDPKVPPKA